MDIAAAGAFARGSPVAHPSRVCQVGFAQCGRMRGCVAHAPSRVQRAFCMNVQFAIHLFVARLSYAAERVGIGITRLPDQDFTVRALCGCPFATSNTPSRFSDSVSACIS